MGVNAPGPVQERCGPMKPGKSISAQIEISFRIQKREGGGKRIIFVIFPQTFQRQQARIGIPVRRLALQKNLVEKAQGLSEIKPAAFILTLYVVPPGVEVVGHLLDAEAPAPGVGDVEIAAAKEMAAPFFWPEPGPLGIEVAVIGEAEFCLQAPGPEPLSIFEFKQRVHIGHQFGRDGEVL